MATGFLGNFSGGLLQRRQAVLGLKSMDSRGVASFLAPLFLQTGGARSPLRAVIINHRDGVVTQRRARSDAPYLENKK
jgi:hypothetical protein